MARITITSQEMTALQKCFDALTEASEGQISFDLIKASSFVDNNGNHVINVDSDYILKYQEIIGRKPKLYISIITGFAQIINMLRMMIPGFQEAEQDMLNFDNFVREKSSAARQPQPAPETKQRRVKNVIGVNFFMRHKHQQYGHAA